MKIICQFMFFLFLTGTLYAETFTMPPYISEFMTEQPSLTRAGRNVTVRAIVVNPAQQAVSVVPELIVPEGIVKKAISEECKNIPANGEVLFQWTITTAKPIYAELKLNVSVQGIVHTIGRLPVRFLEERPVTPMSIIPAPVRPEKTSKILVGAHNCPLWNYDAGSRWDQILKHPERTPALGFYAQESPEVADWETKWAVEHGVDFFIYCWYRTSQGGPVETCYEEAITKALYHSQYQKEIKITIMWENQNRGKAGVTDENDLMKNLLPYWMNNYFKKDNYLKIDNKPVFFIYRPEFLIQDLGSVEKVRAAFDKLRAACKAEGFDGMIILGEYRGTTPNVLQQMKDLGLDYTFAYCQPISNSPLPAEAIERQMETIQTVEKIGYIPQIVTVSQAWSGWHDEGSIWKLPPDDFEVLLRRAKSFIETIPSSQLGSKILILDNWNEWSEGHYLLPYTEYGFGYLDAIARVFTKQPADHEDLLPDDIGKGPYDIPYRKWREEERHNSRNPREWNEKNKFFGWTNMMGISKFEKKNGKLNIISATTDPACYVLFKKGIGANSFDKIRVRMKISGLNGQGSLAQLLWKQNVREDWSEQKSIRLPLVDNGKFNDYLFQVGRSPLWTGQITGLRFDFCSLKNITVEIEEIVLEKK